MPEQIRKIDIDRTNLEEKYDVESSSSGYLSLSGEFLKDLYAVDLEPLSQRFQYFKDRTHEKIRNRIYSFFDRGYFIEDRKGFKEKLCYYLKEKEYKSIYKSLLSIEETKWEESTWTESYYEDKVFEKIRIGIRNILSRLKSFSSLEEGWDGYKGKPVKIQTITKALIFFSFLLYLLYKKKVLDFPLPFITPVADGGIQFEWETCYKELIIYIPEEDEDSFQYLKICKNLWREDEEEGEVSSIIELAFLAVEWLT